MTLYVDGTDITKMTYGFLAEGLWTEGPETVECAPEDRLRFFAELLKSRNVGFADLEAVVLLVGPGSPTAIRAMLALWNTVAFVNDVKLFSVTAEPNESPASVIERALAGQPLPMALPQYGSDPHVTRSTRDALLRPLV